MDIFVKSKLEAQLALDFWLDSSCKYWSNFIGNTFF